MRHRKARLKLNRTSSHRKAMFRNMVTSLFKHERIRTTDVKAKELRRWADNLITLAKRGDLHARRQALSIVREKDVVYKLFEEASEKYGAVSGGYTRIVKLGRRPGDAAPISMVELISKEKSKKKKKTKKKKIIKAAVEEKQVVEKKEEKVEKEEGKAEEKMVTVEPEDTVQDLEVTSEAQDAVSDISKTIESDGPETEAAESKKEDTQSEK
jgi:large subunit ribosomal protein L17